MELILINDSKLKIMLSQHDMNRYALSIEDIDYDNTETRRAFWNILDEAKHKTGFDAAREKIFIQVFPCRSGGCEIFVTKLEQPRENDDAVMNITRKKPCYVYKFSEINDMLSVCGILNNKGYKGESSAYHDDRYYYLTLSGEYRFINEYADGRENKNYIHYIREHCHGICAEDAVSILSGLR